MKHRKKNKNRNKVENLYCSMVLLPQTIRISSVASSSLPNHWSTKKRISAAYRVCSHDVTTAMLEEQAKKRRPFWRSEIFFWGLNSIFVRLPPSVLLCKYGFWSHERTHSIGGAGRPIGPSPYGPGPRIQKE